MAEPADRARSRPLGSRPLGSRLLSAVDRSASRPMIAIILLAADLLWILTSIAWGFPARDETVFQTLVAAVTLAMVFVIQHTQARQQAAAHRKLDEILQAMPGADNSLLTLEHASDDELHATGILHREIRRTAIKEQSSPVPPE